MTDIRRPFNALAVAAIGTLYLPILAVMAYSLNPSRLGVGFHGLTLKWYRAVLANPVVLGAALNTLILAAVSSILATVLGTALAVGLDRFPWSRRLGRAFDTVLYLPVVTPDIIFAAALLVVFRGIRELTGYFQPGLTTMVLAHVTFQISFVALVVRARLATIGPELEEAARDLYADTPVILRRVLLPLLAPAIAAGGLLAFTLSLDDFIISFFTSGPESLTLPLYIYASVKRGVSPELHALSTLVFLLTVALLGLSQLRSHRPAA